MSNYTKGPWHVYQGPPNGIEVRWKDPNGQICPLRWTDRLRPEVEARVLADAYLIAAAPELLAALTATLVVLDAPGIIYGDSDEEPLDVIRVAREAIKKAEGRK